MFLGVWPTQVITHSATSLFLQLGWGTGAGTKTIEADDIKWRTTVEETPTCYPCRHLYQLAHCQAPSNGHYTLAPTLKQQGAWLLNTLRPGQNGRHFPDDIFKCIFCNENVSIPIKIPLKFVPKGPINNIPALVQIMDWRRSGDKPLFEPMMVSLLTHLCVTRLQWVLTLFLRGKVQNNFCNGF